MKSILRYAGLIVRRGLGRAAFLSLALLLMAAGVSLTATHSGSGLLPSNHATVRNSDYGVDVPPTPVDDSYTVNEDQGKVELPVRSNDPDPDGGEDRIAGPDRSHSVHGRLHLPPGRAEVVYIPNPDYCNTQPGRAQDSFTYNYGGRTSATVHITVNCVNDAPRFAHSGTFTYTENDPSHQVSGTVTLVDPDYGPLSGASASVSTGYEAGKDRLTWVDNDASDGITLDPSSSDRHVILTGSANAKRYQAALRAVRYENASDAPSTTTRTIKFRATDPQGATGEGTAVVPLIPVNDLPVAHDDAYSTGDSGGLTVAAAGGVLANDTDVDGDTLTAVGYTDPAHGSLTHDPDGGFTYTPADGYVGTDSFTYRANDGTADSTAAATVTITVKAPGASNSEPADTPGDQPGPPPPPGIQPPPPAPPAVAHVLISHPRTLVSKGKTFVTVKCLGPATARCDGQLTLRASGRATRRISGAALVGVKFQLVGGRSRVLRVALPAPTRAQLKSHRRAVVDAVVVLATSAKATRLLTVISH